jgi:hypothetical protein
MAVLQHNPVSSLLALLDHLLGDWALALSQRNWLDNPLLGLGEGAQGGKRVRSRAQDEDQRAGRVRVTVDFGKIEGRRRDKFLPELAHDVVLTSRNHLLGSNSPKYQQFFEGSKDILNFSRHLLILRLFRVIDLLPLISLGLEAFEEGVELFHEGEAIDFSPALLGNPI